MILDFTVVTFQKEKQFYCAKVTTTLPLRAYLFTFAVFVTAIIYVQNGFSVGNYSLNALSSHAFSLHKTYSV